MAHCLIIAVEGKKGHERQAVAVAERLGLAPRIERVGRAPAALRSTPDLRRAALVIAAGRQSIAPARRLSRAGGAPVAMLQPVVWRPQDFYLIWAPLHDRPHAFLGRPRLLVETLTAPSAVTCAAMQVAALASPEISGLSGPRIGVLVGGASAAHRFGAAEAAELGDRLAAFTAAHDVALLVTTSRRTPPVATAAIADRLAGTRHVLVDAARHPDPSTAYAAILGLADAFVATADSFAMMSEAAATGKPLYGWRLPGGKAKFERFYEGLADHGALRWFDGTLDRWTYPPLDAAGTLAEALRPALALQPASAGGI
jgi:mitochondrial fission protein ELM1